ncbi:polysaccharide deacetylase family protein [Nocardiopsis eucommiae]|uniref:Polysaccharide deacetylase family protein n=2 Tax=Nocardiopsidaceae TaxID=83676 RepID=A0A975LCI2_9ACTN|nr:polysaccharide deacetylase family protein [Nocardiopsis eucommiae]
MIGAATPVTATPAEEAPDCDAVRCVALTFDDGPGEYTDALLDILAEHDARATFYLLGSRVDDHREEVRRMAEEGHGIGNHTWKHDDLTTLSADRIRDDLARTDRAVAEVTGERPRSMRPPYGALDDTAREAIPHPMMLWDVDTLDWQHRDGDRMREIALDGVRDGSVVLFHDIHETTVEAVPELLDDLAERGYHFVTVSELFGDRLEPGTAYSDARTE